MGADAVFVAELSQPLIVLEAVGFVLADDENRLIDLGEGQRGAVRLVQGDGIMLTEILPQEFLGDLGRGNCCIV